MTWLALLWHRFHMRYVTHAELVRRRTKVLLAKQFLLRAKRPANKRLDAYLDVVNQEFDRRRERLNARAKRVKLTGRGTDGVT